MDAHDDEAWRDGAVCEDLWCVFRVEEGVSGTKNREDGVAGMWLIGIFEVVAVELEWNATGDNLDACRGRCGLRDRYSPGDKVMVIKRLV